jgi:hypothetical protein
MVATLKVDIIFSNFKTGNTIEVVYHGFDSLYNENTYKIEGFDFWLPESEIEILSKN